jgi:hypothetical protein
MNKLLTVLLVKENNTNDYIWSVYIKRFTNSGDFYLDIVSNTTGAFDNSSDSPYCIDKNNYDEFVKEEIVIKELNDNNE